MSLGLGLGLDKNSFISAGGFTGLLDTYSGAAAAYSVRLLSSSYTSGLVEIRRSSDNATKAFLPDSNNELSLSSEAVVGSQSLSAFVGSNDGLNVTSYDQSGTSFDLTQGTASNQPQLINSGSLITVNGKPAISFNGSTQSMGTASAVNYGSDSEIWVYMVVNVLDNTTTQILLESSTSYSINSGSFLFYIESGDLYVTKRNTQNTVNRCSISTGQQLISVKIDMSATGTAAHSVYINGVSQTLTNSVAGTTGGTFNDYNLYLAARNNSSVHTNIDLQELFIKTGDQSSNRTGIETNINDFFSIY